jgi:hypothetical protein
MCAKDRSGMIMGLQGTIKTYKVQENAELKENRGGRT